MKIILLTRRKILILIVAGVFSVMCILGFTVKKNDYIKYAEFNVPYSALNIALEADISMHETGKSCRWYEILALLASKYYGDFSQYKDKDLKGIIDDLENGGDINGLSAGMELYDYYLQVYEAVLGGLVGEFEYQTAEGEKTVWKKTYGLKAFSPIAKNFYYEGYDDFGAQRTWGYARRHLGHDMMTETGTPVIAIESGTVECLGWNEYGGWRIGIRSFDSKRYYYYAHLRKNRPYAENLKEGDKVTAGDVIGYVGRTGYSKEENVNNIEVSHLHLGMELVFDESQKECDNEIWIDLYPLTRLLESHRSETVRNSATKEYSRKYNIKEIS